MATGVNAWGGISAETLSMHRTDLEHLDEGDGEEEVCSVTEDEAAAEEDADGQDGPEEELLCHVDVLDTIQQGRCALEDSGADGCEEEMPCDEKHGEPEASGVVQPVVVCDDRGRKDDPYWDDERCCERETA